MNSIIRKMEKDDCKAVSHVITTAWNETYKGLVPDDFLEDLYNKEEENTNKMINHFDSNTHVRYVLEVDGSVVGFINVGPSESEDYKGCGEVFALYILNGYKGYGFGKKLIETGFAELKKLGFDKVVIGCLVGNKANDFYKHLGGKFIATKIYKRLQLPENYYCFENKTR